MTRVCAGLLNFCDLYTTTVTQNKIRNTLELQAYHFSNKVSIIFTRFSFATSNLIFDLKIFFAIGLIQLSTFLPFDPCDKCLLAF